jgi:hypothetical protein
VQLLLERWLVVDQLFQGCAQVVVFGLLPEGTGKPAAGVGNALLGIG